MRNKTIAMMLSLAAVPQTGFAKTVDCPGLECAKRVGAENDEGTVLLEVDTLFKCHGDPESFDGAMAGLAGDLNGHSRRAFGIVTFGDDGYFAFVKAPYRVSAPVFFVQDETSYACVTVQHSRKTCQDKADQDATFVEIDVEEDAIEVAAPDNIAEWPSRLLQANFDAEAEADADNDPSAKIKAERADYPGPKAPPIDNQPAGMPEGKDLDAKDMPMQSGNMGLRDPKAPPLENQPAGMPEAKDIEAEDLPMHTGNIGLREPKAPPLENQPAGLPEAKDIDAKDLPMQSGNIGLREPQAPPEGNQPASKGDGESELRKPAKDKDT